MKRRGGPGQAALCVWLATSLVLLPRGALALGPFEKNHPRVEEGLRAYEDGRFEDALGAFDAARKELPDNAAVEFDRGNALYKLRRLDEAREAYHRVSELDRGQLQQKDYYNLGNALAELGQSKDAIAAYRKALLLDPNDDMARHNMEVVLRDLPPPKQRPQQPDAGDAGQDAGADAGSRDAGQGDGGSDGGTGQGKQDGGTGSGPGDAGSDGGSQGQRDEQNQERQDGGSDPDEDEPEEGDNPDAGQDQQPMPELNRKDVERLLDSMKQSEKNLQLWRFQQRKKAKSSRKDNGKDW
jgi:tetratricopeptide (TPR) repeat protein